MQHIPSLTLSEAMDYLRTMSFSFGRKQENILMLWGQPGIGKSMIMQQLAIEFNATVIEYFASTANESEVVGIPLHDEKEDVIRFRPLENMKFTKDKNYIWFLDEINRGRPEVIQALFSILSSYPRKIGVNEIPDNVQIVMAGNLGESDGTIVTDFNDASFYSKLSHVEVKFDKDEFLNYIDVKYIKSNSHQCSFAKHIHSFLIGKDDSMCNKLPSNPSEIKAFPVPRTIEKLIATFGGKKLTPITLKWGASIVGNPWIQEFSKHIQDSDLGKTRISPAEFFDPNIDMDILKTSIKEMDKTDTINFGKELQTYMENISPKKVEGITYESWKSLCGIIKELPKDNAKNVLNIILDNNEIREAFDAKGEVKNGGDKRFEEETDAIVKKITGKK